MQAIWRYIRHHFNSLASIAIRGFSVLAGFGIAFFIGSTMGPEANGQYALITQTALFLSIFAVGGLDLAIVKEYSAAVSRKIPVERRGLVKTSTYSLILSVVIVAILALGGDRLLTYLMEDKIPADALAVLCLILLTRAMTRITSAYLRSQQSFILAQFVEVLLIPVIVLTAIMAGFFAGISFTNVSAILWFTAITGVVVSGLGISASLWKTVSAGSADGETGLHIPVKTVVTTALPLWGVVVTLAFSDWYGLATVASVLGVYDAGVYRIAIQVGSALAIISGGLFTVFGAQISAASAADDNVQIGRLARSATRLSLLLALPAALFFLVLAEPILGFIGPEFVSGANVLRIIIVGQALFTLTGPASLTLALTGHQKANFLVTLGTTITLIIAAPLAAHLAGINGVAVTVAVLLVSNQLICFVLMRKLMGINVMTGNYRPVETRD